MDTTREEGSPHSPQTAATTGGSRGHYRCFDTTGSGGVVKVGTSCFNLSLLSLFEFSELDQDQDHTWNRIRVLSLTISFEATALLRGRGVSDTLRLFLKLRL